MKLSILLSAAALLAASLVIAQGPATEGPKGAVPAPPGKGKAKGPFQSPASSVRPKATQKQEYPAALVAAGERRFVAECGFCHGRDATGGEGGGEDLTRSDVVASDVGGEKIAAVIRDGVPEEGMPGFRFSAAEVSELVAFIHTQHVKFKSLAGNRRSVLPADLLSGNAAAGRTYFAANCGKCHSATGDLKDIGARFAGLQLMQRFLWPGGRGAARPKATVTSAGKTITGDLASEDEFSLVVQNGDDRQYFEKRLVKYNVTTPLQGHFDLLSKLKDADIHNLYAYLVTLK